MLAAPETRPVSAAEGNRAQLWKSTGRVYSEGSLQGADQHVVLRHEGWTQKEKRGKRCYIEQKEKTRGALLLMRRHTHTWEPCGALLGPHHSNSWWRWSRGGNRGAAAAWGHRGDFGWEHQEELRGRRKEQRQRTELEEEWWCWGVHNMFCKKVCSKRHCSEWKYWKPNGFTQMLLAWNGWRVKFVVLLCSTKLQSKGLAGCSVKQCAIDTTGLPASSCGKRGQQKSGGRD